MSSTNTSSNTLDIIEVIEIGHKFNNILLN